MEMGLYYPFIFLVERPGGFQFSEKTVLFEAKSSHLLVSLIGENCNVNLFMSFGAIKSHLSLNIMNGTFLDNI